MLDLMNLSVKGELGNASSLHSAGIYAKEELIKARVEIAMLVGVSPLELIFTSSGSESNNTIIQTFKDCPIIISSIEHPSVLKPAEEYGNPCIKIPVNKSGIIDLTILRSEIKRLTSNNSKQKILVSVMLANNETGTIEPIHEIASVIEEFKDQGYHNIYLHTDATQAIGKIPVNAKKLKVDYMTFTAHKIGGPIGIAALYSRSGAPYKPLILGGAQEDKRRAGTSNVILAAGFAVAARYCAQNQTSKKYQNIGKLRNYLVKELTKKIPTAKIITPLGPGQALPHILNVAFPAAEGESTQLYLDLDKIEVSTGSACASGDLEPSHVLMAMYHDAEVAHGSIRFSLPLGATKKQVDALIDKLPGIVSKIQDISTLKKEKI